MFRINQEQNGTRFDYRSRISSSARLSVIIQTSIIISSWTFYRAIYYGRSPRQSFARSVSLRRFYNPGYVKNVVREVSKFHRKAAIDDHPAEKEDDSRRGVKNSNLNRI